MTFTDFNLSSELLRAIDDLHFETPMPIQELMIPQLLTESDDLVGLAHTGTGKTAAFGLPVIQRIDLDTRSPQALVLCPTRELCIQITGELKLYSKYIPKLSVTSIYGGDSYERQKRELRKGSHIIVATPGRLLDLVKRKSANIGDIQFLILDEADIMLNMGFKEELDGILESAPAERQTILLSATMPREVVRIANTYMSDPIELTVGQKNTGTETVNHQYYTVRRHDKYAALKRLVDFHPEIYAIVFCRTRAATQDIAEKLVHDRYNAEALHGDLSQAQREHVMTKFRSGSVRLLVATDIAARGLDVDDLTHVIHYDLPTEVDAYTHRSGRTGRAGKTGTSLALITDKERARIRWIERIVKRKFTEAKIPGKHEICEQQLVQLIDRVQKVDVDSEQLAPYLPMIEEKLSELSKEELLQRFVSLEFNALLEYYKNLEDIRPVGKKDRHSTEKRGRGFNKKYDRSGNYATGRKFERNSDRKFDRKPFPPKYGKKQSAGNTTNDADYNWLAIDVGRKEKVLPLDIIGLCNQGRKNGHTRLGRIDIGESKSWIQVQSQVVNDVFSTLRDASYKGRKVRVERANDSPGRAQKTA